jgi:predicted porin
MKKHLLAHAALALCATTASAQSSVTIFGIADAAIRSTKNGSAASLTGMTSDGYGSSQLGFRGTEDLGGGLSANFWLESQISLPSGATGSSNLPGQFFNRKSTVSLASKSLGEIRLGRDYTGPHLLQCRFDPFGCNSIGASSIFRNSTATSINQAFGSTGTNQHPLVRVSNSAQYILPQGLGGAFGGLMYSDGKEDATSVAGNSKATGAHLGYADQKLYVAAAFFNTKNTLVAGETFRDTAFAANYDFGFFKTGVMHRIYKYQSAKLVTTSLSASVPVTDVGTASLTYVRANQRGTTAANADIGMNDANMIALGYLHLLSKRTALYASVAQLDNKGGARFVLPGGRAGILAGEKSTGYQAGIRHTF